jgi:uncharacterized membrane-anchored protein YitT (DUF2179 family)
MKNLSSKEKKDAVIRFIYLVLSNLLSALAVDMFLSGNGISGGGFAGIAIIINYIVYIPVGLFVFVLTIPLFIWAYFVKGWRYVLDTLVSTAMYSLMTDLLVFLPCVTADKFLAAVCGGVLYALSEVCMLRANCASGGTDLLDRLILTKKKNASLGMMFIVIDGSIVLASAIVSGQIEIGIYGFICVFVSSILTDRLIRGFDTAIVYQIVTKAPAVELANAILQEMERGVTRLNATGMYTSADKAVLVVAVRPREAYRLKQLVRSYDPDAFVMVLEASEIMGSGFESSDHALHGTVSEKHK